MTPVVVTASAPSLRWVSAPARSRALARGQSGIEDGEGVAIEYEPKEHLSVKEARRADRFTQFAMARATRRSARPEGPTSAL